jgi:hypothetical protein
MAEAETVNVVDVFQAQNAAVRHLMSSSQVATRWQCTRSFARKRLLQSGIRLCRVYGGQDQGWCVRKRDVLAVEKALTVYLKAKPSVPNQLQT